MILPLGSDSTRRQANPLIIGRSTQPKHAPQGHPWNPTTAWFLAESGWHRRAFARKRGRYPARIRRAKWNGDARSLQRQDEIGEQASICLRSFHLVPGVSSVNRVLCQGRSKKNYRDGAEADHVLLSCGFEGVRMRVIGAAGVPALRGRRPSVEGGTQAGPITRLAVVHKNSTGVTQPPSPAGIRVEDC